MQKLSRKGNHFKSLVSGISEILLGSQSGCLVRMNRCDVASSEKAGSALKESKESFAVMHAGGVLRDATVAKQTSGSMAASMAPKSTGLFRMHASSFANATHSTTLFSSVAALLGSGGQVGFCRHCSPRHRMPLNSRNKG